MDQFGSGNRPGPTRSELAWELVELFDELGLDQINEMVAKNVPYETLEFFTSYAARLEVGLHANESKQRPNLMLIGYLVRILEERLLESDRFDA